MHECKYTQCGTTSSCLRSVWLCQGVPTVRARACARVRCIRCSVAVFLRVRAQGKIKQYILILDHCSSRTISKVTWEQNQFQKRADVIIGSRGSVESMRGRRQFRAHVRLAANACWNRVQKAYQSRCVGFNCLTCLLRKEFTTPVLSRQVDGSSAVPLGASNIRKERHALFIKRNTWSGLSRFVQTASPIDSSDDRRPPHYVERFGWWTWTGPIPTSPDWVELVPIARAYFGGVLFPIFQKLKKK